MSKLDFTDLKNYRTREDILNDLCKSAKPVVVYGTGKFAVSVAEMVVSNGIQLECFIDEEKYYYVGKSKKIAGVDYPCVLFREFELPFNEYNVLLGNIDYSKMPNCQKLFEGCQHVDYLDAYQPHIMDFVFLKSHEDEINKIHSILQDDESKAVLDAYISARYTGDVRALCGLAHVDYLYDWNLLNILESDIFVDGGAFIGDSIKEIQKLKGYLPREIFAFEPDTVNLSQLLRNFTPEELQKIHPIAAGLYSGDTRVRFKESGTLGSAIDDTGETIVPMQALDSHPAYSHVSVIKMDIEGCEVSALRGAHNLIKRERPRLAICVYHNNQDLFDIVQFLKPFNYNLYLRQHSFSAEETVLYAI